jgi:hypothetical protein
MPEDLAYLLETPSEEEEQRVRAAVEAECLRAISAYLEEVATAMDANGIESIGSVALRAMSEALTQRTNNDQDESTSSD